MPWEKLDPRRYRVFKAESFLATDLAYEIKWHKKHIGLLEKYTKKPHLYHEAHGHAHKTEEEKERHYREHVVDSLPFHRKLLHDHTQRQKLLVSFFPKSKLRTLRKLNAERSYLPDYLIYDKTTDSAFFANTFPTTAQQVWAHEAQTLGVKVEDLSKWK